MSARSTLIVFVVSMNYTSIVITISSRIIFIDAPHVAQISLNASPIHANSVINPSKFTTPILKYWNLAIAKIAIFIMTVSSAEIIHIVAIAHIQSIQKMFPPSAISIFRTDSMHGSENYKSVAMKVVIILVLPRDSDIVLNIDLKRQWINQLQKHLNIL